MERDAAIQLVNSWNQLPNQPEAGRAYHRLTQALVTVLPSDITAGGAALVENVPTVLALNATNVFTVIVDPQSGDKANVTVRRFPLAAERMRVDLVDNIAGELPNDVVGAHLRDWTFTWVSGEVLNFGSVVKVYNGWSDAPQSAERFARALAAALGWEMPSDER